ncbi:acetamidase [Gordonibacter sp. An230]|uniref:acetamidase/formamidase family protein n=1 Tax=Gordonibacter sp. An230 TaxID=1965592 RepID=UPI000B3A3BBC|nr:acetamidase/formamidase family protein [Gordonibacter sp. An230]OUO91092.1 acetamidase [Gordonibacter sp. An230]
MRQLNDERVLFAFSREAEPALTVKSGETVRIRTQDCFGNQVRSSDDVLDEIDWDRINPATGPVYVEGAIPGGALKVTIEGIELDAQTASCTGKDEGVCGDRFEAWSTRLCAVDAEKGVLSWSDELSIPLKPMIGVIGVAPAGEPVNCGTPGSHGGNMDATVVTTGATLYFPVATEGALFGCGDMHAAMGDGEVSVSGAEVAGWATVTLTALPDLHLVDPVIENETHMGVIASAESLDAAADRAVHEMVDLLHDRTGVAVDELVMVLSLVADVQVCQMVDPQKTVRFMVPKYVLGALGFAL